VLEPAEHVARENAGDVGPIQVDDAASVALNPSVGSERETVFQRAWCGRFCEFQHELGEEVMRVQRESVF